MENHTRIKNSHRLAALKLAISRTNERSNKPLLDRRTQLCEHLAMAAFKVLRTAQEPFTGLHHLVGAGVCQRKTDLALSQFSDSFAGAVELNPVLANNWHLVSSPGNAPLVRLVHPGQNATLPLPGEVISFEADDRSPKGNMVPVARIDWIVRATRERELPENETITAIIREITGKIAPEMLRSFDKLPDVVKLLGDCATYGELIEAFPAASTLFESDERPEVPAQNPNAISFLNALA